ncbi:sugar ABC transporter permease [Siculibacillus lacustris]|uniref:Sugar ABC transporter permease n=1 Tax=Siculibacillus lacustris TaxID=1549641 RepID=A0A4Q9VTR7_9HYPH|nr:sugar ABC transporter permease [Siculibacillus lacustris]TBW39504.1 sugar ABC transporter permease [Siculibacillus lacustris]
MSDVILPPQPSSLPARLARGWARMKRNHIGFVICALGPVLALFVVIRIYPIAETIRLSFYDYHITRRSNPFVGLGNYAYLFEDGPFHEALVNTILFSMLAVVATLLLALACAILLRSIEKAAPIYELLFYIPVVTPWVPASVIWKWIFDPTFGALNYALSFFGVARLGWLQDPTLILFALVAVSVWKMVGYFVVIFGVGLRAIPEELLEAADLDGATAWRKLTRIVLPLMRPIILFSVVTCTIINFNVFAPVYVLTASSQGAPAYDFKVLVGEIYSNGFVYYHMGYAGAQCVVLLLFVMSLLIVQFLAFREKK